MAIVVIAIVPSSDRVAGGASAIVLGSGFVATPTVTIGGTPATSVVFISATKLTCVVPAGAAGAANVVVTNPDMTNATFVNGLTYYAPVADLTQLVGDIGGHALSVQVGTVAIQRSSSQEQATFQVCDQNVPPFTPVRLGLGSLAAGDLLFIGKEQATKQSAKAEILSNPLWDCAVAGSLAEFNRHLAWGAYVGSGADVVAIDLVQKFAPDFTWAHIPSGLAAVTVSFQGDTMDAAFTQLKTLIGGYYYRDDSYDVHLFVTETPDLMPDSLDATNMTLILGTLTWTADVSQIRNRVIGIGASVQTVLPTPTGANTISLVDTEIFDMNGVVLTPNGELVTYTGKSYGFLTQQFADWVSQTSPAAINWQSVCYAAELPLFVAVGNSAVMSSSDGVIWTNRTSASASGWASVCWSPELSLFAAVASNAVMTSPDGITWTSRTPAANRTWTSICWSAALTLFVAVAGDGVAAANAVMTSPDGITWTSRTAAKNLIWWKVIWVNKLSKFIAIADNSSATNVIMTSSDSITWVSQSLTFSGYSGGKGLTWSSSLNLLLVAQDFTGGAVATATSPDGVTWTIHTSALPGGAGIRDITWLESGYFVAVGSSNAPVVVSLDGITWTNYLGLASGTRVLTGLAWASAVGRLIAVGGTTTPTGNVLTNSAVVYRTLTGCSGISTGFPAGSSISLYTERDDLTSQAAVKVIEGDKSDGIYEFKITDSSLITQASLDARCDAELLLFSDAGGILQVNYQTFDRKSRYGRPLHVNLEWRPGQFLTGDFVIQTVSVTDVGVYANSNPRFTCMASSMRYTLEDLLRHVMVLQ